MKMRTTVTDEMIAKLPVWAQTYIEGLKREKDTLEHQLQRVEEERTAQFVGTTAPTRVSWEYLMEGPHFLHSGVNVRFYVGENLQNGQWITMRWREREKALDVNCSDTLVIEPQASNSVYLLLQKR